MRHTASSLQVMVTNRRHMANRLMIRITTREYSLSTLLFGRSSADSLPKSGAGKEPLWCLLFSSAPSILVYLSAPLPLYHTLKEYQCYRTIRYCSKGSVQETSEIA